MVKSIGTLASESLGGYVSGIFLGVTNLPAISAGRFTPLAAHFANNAAWLVRRCVLNCNMKVANLNAPALHFPTPRARS